MGSNQGYRPPLASNPELYTVARMGFEKNGAKPKMGFEGAGTWCSGTRVVRAVRGRFHFKCCHLAYCQAQPVQGGSGKALGCATPDVVVPVIINVFVQILSFGIPCHRLQIAWPRATRLGKHLPKEGGVIGRWFVQDCKAAAAAR